MHAEILKLAACIGDSFSTDIFLTVSGKEHSGITSGLTAISNEGFLIITKDIITFVHDKIREATYTLISKEEKANQWKPSGMKPTGDNQPPSKNCKSKRSLQERDRGRFYRGSFVGRKPTSW